MRVALIDVDGHNFPNLPLMKLSAWHKQNDDTVEWYDPLTAWKDQPDLVYMSKVFTFTPDYPHPVSGRTIVKGGTGVLALTRIYRQRLRNGKRSPEAFWKIQNGVIQASRKQHPCPDL